MPPLSDKQKDGPAGASAPARKKKGLVGKLWGGTVWLVSAPLRLFPRAEIGRNAALIRTLFETVKRRPGRRGGIEIQDDRSFDLAATAFFQGISVSRLEVLLEQRRRATARLAYISFALGWFAFAGWAYRLAGAQWSDASAVVALEFAPVCAAFFLFAFKNALQNYQIRTRRVATAAEYLRTREPFWPR
jgi:hypothetical protein